MGWVDLWRGILLCDVLTAEPKLRGVPVPLPLDHLRCNNGQGTHLGCPKFLRGITFIDKPGVKPCLKFVHLGVTAIPISDDDSDEEEDWEMRDWTITTWTNNKMTSSYNDWDMDCQEVIASCTSISSKLNSKMLKSGLLSPGGAKPKRAFQNLLVSSPALGIDDSVVYLQARVKFLDPKVFVLALDTRDNKLLGAVEFATERIRGADVVYLPSNIGKYIDPEDRVLPIPEDDSNWEESSQYEGTEYLKLTRLQFKFLSVIRGLTSRKVNLQAPSSGKASLNDATIAPLPFSSVKLVIRVSGTKLGDYRSQRAYYEVYGPQSDSSLPQLIAFKQFLESKSVYVECPVDDLVTHEDCITVSKIIKEGECKCKAHYAKSTASLWTIFTTSLPVYE